MTRHISGGCLCGAVRYESDAEPAMPFFCHCRDCQRINGSAFTAGFVLPRDSLTIQGTVKGYTAVADSGNKITRQFCPECGSQLFGELERMPSIVIIKVGTLDDPRDFNPEVHLWAQSEMPWAHIEDGVRRLPKGRS